MKEPRSQNEGAKMKVDKAFKLDVVFRVFTAATESPPVCLVFRVSSHTFLGGSGKSILKGNSHMTSTIRKLLVGAALSGFVAGTSAVARAQDTGDQGAAPAGKATKKAKVAKHCCAGQNSCKGQGGCGANKGKNDCKGQGGCSTYEAGCKGKGPCKEKPAS